MRAPLRHIENVDSLYFSQELALPVFGIAWLQERRLLEFVAYEAYEEVDITCL